MCHLERICSRHTATAVHVLQPLTTPGTNPPVSCAQTGQLSPPRRKVGPPKAHAFSVRDNPPNTQARVAASVDCAAAAVARCAAGVRCVRAPATSSPDFRLTRLLTTLLSLLLLQFRKFYERGDLPVQVEHKGHKNVILWKVLAIVHLALHGRRHFSKVA